MLSQEGDVELLRESRRLRRKQKKDEKRLKKEKEKEKNLLALKFGSKDTRITIVTKEFVSSIANSSNTSNVTSLEIRETDFPVLGQVPVKTDKQKNSEKVINNEEQETKGVENACEKVKRTKAAIKIDIKHMITKPEKIVQKEKEKALIKHYEGNTLDSSQPERKKGKYRETPIIKKPSKLKSLLLKEQNSVDKGEEKKYVGIHSAQFEMYVTPV